MNLETVEQVVALISEYPVSEVTLEQDGQRIHVRRSAHLPTTAPLPQTVLNSPNDSVPDSQFSAPERSSLVDDTLPPEKPVVLLTAPMVGVFHHPAQPFRYGGMISPGQIVGSIESMKLMNDVLADKGGQVVEVFIEDGTPVEYGQPLFRLAEA